MATRDQRLKQSSPTLEAALKKYTEEVSTTKRSTVQDISIAKQWCNTFIKDRLISNIRQVDLIRIRDEWLETLSPATVVRRFSILSHMYTISIKDWGFHWLDNPVKLVRRPVVNDQRDRRLYHNIVMRGIVGETCPKTELEWLLIHSNSAELNVIIQLAIETAMRRGEILGIKREHIDLQRGIVFLPFTKNGSTRYVPLTPRAKELMREFLKGKSSKGPIFSISTSFVTSTFIRLVKRCRRKYLALCKKYKRRPNKTFFINLRFHDLRHEGCSRLAGIFQMHELAKITGHKDTRMLLRYYHPSGAELVKKLYKSELGKKQLADIKKG